MRFVLAALAYIADPAHWSGAMGIGPLLVQHVLYSLAGVLIAALIGVPAGWWVGHTGRGRTWVQPLSGTARSLPTLGLITLFGLVLGVGLSAPMIAFVILALPSVLAGAMSGVRAASVMAVDGARASGMSELQVLGRVEIPLGRRCSSAGCARPASRSSPPPHWPPTPAPAGSADSCSWASRPRTTS